MDLRPKPAHKSDDRKTMLVFLGGIAGSLLLFFTLNYLAVYLNSNLLMASSYLVLGASMLTVYFQTQKYRKPNQCDFCEENVGKSNITELYREEDGKILGYDACPDCFSEESDQHIPIDEMEWDWKHMRLKHGK